VSVRDLICSLLDIKFFGDKFGSWSYYLRAFTVDKLQQTIPNLSNHQHTGSPIIHPQPIVLIFLLMSKDMTTSSWTALLDLYLIWADKPQMTKHLEGILDSGILTHLTLVALGTHNDKIRKHEGSAQAPRCPHNLLFHWLLVLPTDVLCSEALFQLDDLEFQVPLKTKP
jgi:hypothetical protein